MVANTTQGTRPILHGPSKVQDCHKDHWSPQQNYNDLRRVCNSTKSPSCCDDAKYRFRNNDRQHVNLDSHAQGVRRTWSYSASLAVKKFKCNYRRTAWRANPGVTSFRRPNTADLPYSVEIYPPTLDAPFQLQRNFEEGRFDPGNVLSL